MQWRLACGGVFSYFGFFLLTPVMFHYHGAETAGQMGLTWALIAAMQAAALAWVQTRVPRFGILIAKQDYVELDRIFRRLTVVSLVAIAAGGAAIVAIVYVLPRLPFELTERMAQGLLSPLPTLLLVLTVVIDQVLNCQVFYVRAHKREPFLALNVTSNLLIGLAVWLLGSRCGPTGAAWGYLGVTAFYLLPYTAYIWSRSRREWH
jgi:O-antigen/teichoic acid export membrane protein